MDRAALFFGQGMTVTSLQLAMAMAAIANGGKLMRPYVVEGVVDGSGRRIRKVQPKMVRRVISGRTAEKVGDILEKVVSENGTGNEASIEGFQVAGKTGTAQKVDPVTRRYSNTKYVAAFVGFVPADHPRLVILVVIDEPSGPVYGGVVAGPVFREVGQWSLNYLRINPQLRLAGYEGDASPRPLSREEIQGKEHVRREAASALIRDIQNGVLPDFRGLPMREVMKKGHAMGLDMALKGTGFAVKQKPGPGYPLKSVQTVEVQFTSPAS
jgi:cell division protein FtsI (penicillin-binding protein 3)